MAAQMADIERWSVEEAMMKKTKHKNNIEALQRALAKYKEELNDPSTREMRRKKLEGLVRDVLDSIREQHLEATKMDRLTKGSISQHSTLDRLDSGLGSEEVDGTILHSSTLAFLQHSLNSYTGTESFKGVQRKAHVLRAMPGQDLKVQQHEGDFTGKRGIKVEQTTQVTVTNSHQTFEWRGYGLRLSIPPHTLPDDLESCMITIKLSLSGQYRFPPNTHPVSPVFWIKCRPRCKFKVPLTLEIQHCAPLRNSHRLLIARASCAQQNLPYSFNILRNAVFGKYSSYGIVTLNQFSGLCAVQEGSDERRYWSSLFYMGRLKHQTIHFAVTWHHDAHITTVKKAYGAKDATSGSEQILMFKEDTISLSIPDEGCIQDDWRVVPTFPPQIFKRDVDDYFSESKSQAVPHCELVARWKRQDREVEELEYLVHIQGTAVKRYFRIMIDPSASEEQLSPTRSTRGSISSISSFSQVHKGSHSRRQSHSAVKAWLLTDQQNISMPAGSNPVTVVKSGDVNFLVEHLYAHAYKWKEIGASLSFTHGELENIQCSSSGGNVQKLLTQLLSQWSQWPTTDHHDDPTMERLCDALRSGLVGLGAEANDLYEHRHRLPSQQHLPRMVAAPFKLTPWPSEEV